MKNVCIEISERTVFEFDAIGSDGDHVHLFVGAEPKYSPSKVMQTIKSITARQIFNNTLKPKNSFGVVNFGVIEVTLEQ